MRHNVVGRKLGRTASHKRALLANLATSLFEHKRLVTTIAKAKELRPFAEQLITRARNAYNGEKTGTIQGIDVHGRRMVARFIKNKAVLQELFDTIAPLVAERNGGYTRITKLGKRRGDNTAEAVIELVDWSNPVDGRISTTTRKRVAPPTPKPKQTVTASAAPAAQPQVVVAEDVVEEAPIVAEEVDVVEATPETATIASVEAAEAVEEAPEAPAADAEEEEPKA